MGSLLCQLYYLTDIMVNGTSVNTLSGENCILNTAMNISI